MIKSLGLAVLIVCLLLAGLVWQIRRGAQLEVALKQFQAAYVFELEENQRVNGLLVARQAAHRETIDQAQKKRGQLDEIINKAGPADCINAVMPGAVIQLLKE